MMNFVLVGLCILPSYLHGANYQHHSQHPQNLRIKIGLFRSTSPRSKVKISLNANNLKVHQTRGFFP